MKIDNFLTMFNQPLSKIFSDIALYLEMDNVAFKPQAYEKAALVLQALDEDVGDIYKKQGMVGLEAVEGVGASIAEKIEEYLKTGKIKYYEQLKRKMPIDIEALTNVEGLGSKMVKLLYQKLKIKSLEDLERAAKDGKIRGLPRFGLKSEQNILQGIEFLKRSKGRFALGKIYPKVEEIYNKLEGLKEVEKISLAGSLRRMKETIGDVDFLVVSKKPEKVMDFFVSLPGVVKVWDKGLTKSSVRMADVLIWTFGLCLPKAMGPLCSILPAPKSITLPYARLPLIKASSSTSTGFSKELKC